MKGPARDPGVPTIFAKSRPGAVGVEMPAPERPPEAYLPGVALRRTLPLPELSEVEVIRHYTSLSRRNYGVDLGFYPLGSCTMKYNPKVNEEMARLPGFAWLHPYQPEGEVQGALRLLYELQRDLAAVTGMDAVTLQPAAGAQGELAGMLIVKAYHRHRQDRGRRQVLVPDSAHGTNPATAAMAGFEVVHVPSDARGGVDVAALRGLLSERTAAVMLTNPNTLGVFDENIVEIARLTHAAGGLVYYDGANLNAILGVARPGDMGFDVVHLNLHKTFSTPHGGGGPGAGPVGVKAFLRDFLPVPVVVEEAGRYRLSYDLPHSIGQLRSFYGNFGVLVRAYTYLRALGRSGLRQVAEDAVLNANYLLARLKGAFHVPYDRLAKHEFVVAPPRSTRQKGVRTLDIAKRLLDYGFHPPTVYFPLIVEEALMIEPTETENKATLDAFADALLAILREAEEDPARLLGAPYTTPVRRLDEARAARQPNLKAEI